MIQVVFRICREDQLFCKKAPDIAKNRKYERYQTGLASTLYIFLENYSGTHERTLVNHDNQQLAKELHKLKIKRFNNYKVESFIRGNISVTELADIQLKSKYNKRI